MTQSAIALLAEYPILTLFVVIGLGYLLGEISLFGFRLGVTGVLFVGLGVGALSPAVALPEVVPSLGLIIFVYAVGINSGKAFFESFQRQGYRDSLVTVAVLAFGAVLTIGVARVAHLPAARAAGLFCGALTNTPALAATRELVHERAAAAGASAADTRNMAEEPVVAYSIAYPIGVIGVLLCFQFLRRIWRVEFTAREEGSEILVRDFVVRNPGIIGRTIGDVLSLHKELGFVISRIQKGGATDIARSDTTLDNGDIVAVVGEETALDRARQIFGESSEAHIELDRSQLDFRRIYVSSKDVAGKRIRDLDLQSRLGATITRLRRGDVDIVPAPETRLEAGDHLRVLTRTVNFQAVRNFFGDSIRGTVETDFGSVALGMVLGVFLGMLPIPLPGGTVVRLGLAGGPLLMALLLGKLERSGRVTWVIPISANITLRQIGLLLFLAGVGTRAGFAFVGTLRSNGVEMLAAGAAITFGVTLGTMIFGYKVLGIPYDSLLGMMSGVQTQPACLAYASAMASPSEAPNLAYAAVYPAAMIAKIVLAQLLVAWLGG
jgi:putative transport protein